MALFIVLWATSVKMCSTLIFDSILIEIYFSYLCIGEDIKLMKKSILMMVMFPAFHAGIGGLGTEI